MLKLRRAYESGIADSLKDACLAPWLVALSAVVGDKWLDCNRIKYATENSWERSIGVMARDAGGFADQVELLVTAPDFPVH